MKFNKDKILQILLTALLSALLAFLQSIVAHLTNSPILESSPEVAGGIGASIRALQILKG